MTRAHKLKIAGRTAIIAALMGGSSLSFAQDAAPTVAAPAQPAPVAAPASTSVVAPPPAVSTLPSPNDTINPAAAQEAAAEAPRRREAAATPKAVSQPRVTPPVSAAPTIAVPETTFETSTDTAPPAVDGIEPAGTTIDETAPVAPVDQGIALYDGFSSEDMILVGGLAAALSALGLGAAFASRRRRRLADDDRPAIAHAGPRNAAPPPIKEDPVFQQFAPAPTPAATVGETVKRAPVTTRPDVPVTDPLFGTPAMAGPITDPLFAPRNDVQPPIIDPLFAKHDRFAGRTSSGSVPTRERELVN
jgi:DNA polymerase III subunit gamma/tau